MPPKARSSAPASKSTAGKAKGSKIKPKATQKPPLSTEERLKRLFTSLCAQIDGGHFTNAIKTCDKILRLEPKDRDAVQTKLFLLLQTEQYNAALTMIDQGEGYMFEKAYSLYRVNREIEARDTMSELKKVAGEDDRGITHLEAQLCYREGSYDPAFDLYNQLLDTSEPHSDEHADILTNLEASQKHLDFINTGYLRALDALPASVTNALETAPPPQPTSSLSATIAAVSQAQADPAAKEKKVRLKRVPQGVVPGVTPPPDPERWLKRSERSTFGQGRRRKAGGGGATQGSMESGPSGGASAHGGKGGGKGRKKK